MISNFSAPTSIVVTSIAAPNRVMEELASQSKDRNFRFYVIGDVPSPPDFAIEGCDFYSIERQDALDFECARLLPKRHYARKNIGYLLAIANKSRLVIETDDDNMPRPEFWSDRNRTHRVRTLSESGWVNAYSFFSDALIWPRGLPLDEIRESQPPFESLTEMEVFCPIQQALADDDPDVDALYRLLLPLPIQFRKSREVAFGSNTWTPFNSQSTAWFPEAYPLLYLPAYCSVRLTDIWRGFVAQRVAWVNNWAILFRSPDVYQIRNEHKLMRDFADEIPGYLHNRTIAENLSSLSLKPGEEHLPENLLMCYEMLVRMRMVDEEELELVQAWLSDLSRLGVPGIGKTVGRSSSFA